MTVIYRKNEMTLPSVTVCTAQISGTTGNLHGYLLECTFGLDAECKSENLTIIRQGRYRKSCVRLNYGQNKTELQKANSDGYPFGYQFTIYFPNTPYLMFAITDNSVQVVENEIEEQIFPGNTNRIALTKINQKILSQPFSKCREAYYPDHVNRQDNCIEGHIWNEKNKFQV